MPPVEKNPYFVYYEGIGESLLPLQGTLVFDYANPKTTRRPYRHNGEKDLFKDPPIAIRDERAFCNMLWSQHTDAMFNIDIKKVVDVSHKRANSDLRLVVGKPGSKTEIIDSDNFFEDLLKDPEVVKWFQTRLSVAKFMSRFYAMAKNAVSPPSIWLLTGTYAIEDATVYSVRLSSSSDKASAKVPVTDPTGLSGLVGLKAGVTVGLGDGVEAHASTQIMGRKIWAARWQKVQTKYFAAAILQADTGSMLRRIRLLSVWSMGTERGSDEEETLVDFELGEGISEDSKASENMEIDPQWWEKFEENLDDLLEDLEE